MDLLTVMRRLTTVSSSLPYFPLCRELGTHVVDSMVRGRLLELRWSPTVTEEGMHEPTARQPDELGPRLVPTTPIVAYAMKDVLKEYDRWETNS
jgi:hypothetical protein